MAVSAPRAIFTGVLKVSMAAIPIKVAKGTESADKETTLHQMHRGSCGGAVGRQNICKSCGDVVQSADIGRGVNGVPVDDDLLDSFKVTSDKAIEVTEFVPLASIDRRLFDEPRYVMPDKGGADALRAFSDTMLDRSIKGQPVAAIGKVAEREREKVVALYAIPIGEDRTEQSVLVLHVLRWPDDVRDASPIAELTAAGKPVTEQLKGGVNALIDQMLVEAFDPTAYVDEKGIARTEALRAIAEGGTPAPGAEPNVPTASADLMAALRASIEATAPKAQAVAAKPEPTKKKASKKGGS